MADDASSSSTMALQATAIATAAVLHGSEENCSAVHNSIDTAAAAAVREGNKNGMSNDGDNDNDNERKSKRHSGPRKRRPKKKPADTSAAMEVPPVRVAPLPPYTGGIGDDALPPLTSNGSAADDIEALLQKELALTAAALDADGDDEALAPPSHPVYHCRTHRHHHTPPPSQPEQAGELALADMDFALPVPLQPGRYSPELPPSQSQHHMRYHHTAASATGSGPLYASHHPTLSALPVASSAADAGRLPPPPLSPPLPPTASSTESGEHDRSYWTQWVIAAAEKERARRLNVLKQLQRDEEEEIQRRRKWAIDAIEREQEAMMRELFIDNMKNTQWFQSTISRLAEDYEVVCPNSWFGCAVSCMLKDLEPHLERCAFRQVPDTLDHVVGEDALGADFYSYDVVCPNAVLGCNEICARKQLAAHLAACPVNGISREKEWEERLEGRRHVLLATEQERARRVSEQQLQQRTSSTSGGDDDNDGHRFSFGHLQRLYEEQTAMMQVVLHDEIVDFCEQEARAAQRLRPWIHVAVAHVTRAIEDLWGAASHVESYGSFATQLHGGYSDVDLVVFGVAGNSDQGRTCQQCVSALAAHFASLSSSATASQSPSVVEVSAITKASIPLLKAVVLVTVSTSTQQQQQLDTDAVLRVPFDITFDDPTALSHNGIASAALVSTLAQHFYGLRELAFVLKRFLAKRGVNDPYVGGLSSYGLLLMIIYVLQEQGALVATLAETDAPELASLAATAAATTTAYTTETQCDGGDDDERRACAAHPRCAAQRRKGEQVAHEIIRQSLARQQRRVESSSNGTSRATKRKTRRPHLPSMLTAGGDESEFEAKPHLLGKYLMDFLQFYGNDFRQHVDAIVVSGWRDVSADSGDSVPGVLLTAATPPGSGRSSLAMSPPAPVSTVWTSPPPSVTCPSPPPLPPTAATAAAAAFSPLSVTRPSSPLSHEGLLMIRDPLQPENNVGKSCYRVSQVCRDFSDFLSFLTALIVRGSVMTTGKKTHRRPAITPSDTDQVSSSLLPSSLSSLSLPSDVPAANSVAAASAHVRMTSHRILTSVFEMKTRDTRASIDLSI